MWIYLKEGFFSIIEHPESKKHFLVRARVKDDIERVFGPKAEHTPDSDYAYRAPMRKDEVAAVISENIGRITYKNFKNAIDDKERREYWYGRVWDDMAMMQEQLAMYEEIKQKA